MKIILICLFLSVTLFAAGNSYSQSCCGGSIFDIAVLSLDKKALFNAGFNYDNYNGVWDQKGTWIKTNNTSWQIKPVISTAYRFDTHLQAGVSIPYVINRNELPGLKPSGSGFGDIALNGRYEIFHEFQRYKTGSKNKVDTEKPYLALTFGLIVPTGKSDETAMTEAEITGKGFFTTSLGISVLKSIVKDKFQISTDLSWQHSFKKTYDKYYNETIPSTFTKSQGDRFNYGISFTYLIDHWNAASLSAGGFSQGPYKIDDSESTNSNEYGWSFTASYTYFPVTFFRITPSFKWYIPKSSFGKNTTGSLLFILNFVYYLENSE